MQGRRSGPRDSAREGPQEGCTCQSRHLSGARARFAQRRRRSRPVRQGASRWRPPARERAPQRAQLHCRVLAAVGISAFAARTARRRALTRCARGTDHVCAARVSARRLGASQRELSRRIATLAFFATLAARRGAHTRLLRAPRVRRALNTRPGAARPRARGGDAPFSRRSDVSGMPSKRGLRKAAAPRVLVVLPALTHLRVTAGSVCTARAEEGARALGAARAGLFLRFLGVLVP